MAGLSSSPKCLGKEDHVVWLVLERLAHIFHLPRGYDLDNLFGERGFSLLSLLSFLIQGGPAHHIVRPIRPSCRIARCG